MHGVVLNIIVLVGKSQILLLIFGVKYASILFDIIVCNFPVFKSAGNYTDRCVVCWYGRKWGRKIEHGVCPFGDDL